MYILAPIPIRFFVVVDADAALWFLVVCFVNDSLKALLAASLLRRRSDDRPWFHTLNGFLTYLIVAVGLVPALSAFVGAACRVQLGAEFWPAWRQWFFGNALPNLSLTPALCCLFLDMPSVMHAPKTRRIEILLIILGLLVGAGIAFNNGVGDLQYPLWLLYLPVPFVLWAAIRFGALGTSVVVTSVSFIAMFGALSRFRLISVEMWDPIIFSVQQFLLVPSIPFLLFSVLITAARKTEATLRENDLSFRSLLNTTPVLVWTSDNDGLRTFFNQCWLDFTGRPLANELGNGWLDGVHPEDRESYVREYRTALEARRNFMVEYRIRRHDSDYRWILESGIPDYQSTGDFRGFVGSCIDITDRRKAETELGKLASRLIEAQEAERQRIGQELHDDLGQKLVCLSLGIERLSKDASRDQPIASHCGELRQQAAEIIQDVGRLSHQLRPTGLQYFGLPATLRSLCRQASDPNGVAVAFSTHGVMPEELPAPVSLALYRVAQEALRNALTHSASDRINVELTASDNVLTLVVADHGCGFDIANRNARGLGMAGMAERMHDVGGSMTIESRQGVGTTITASVQIKRAAPSHRRLSNQLSVGSGSDER
jgi:PAS domain S-box-containing protein